MEEEALKQEPEQRSVPMGRSVGLKGPPYRLNVRTEIEKGK